MLTTKQILASNLGGNGRADTIHFGLYSFVSDETGHPLLEGGKYDTEGLIQPNKYEGEQAERGGYVGRPRVVYMIVRHNQLGAEYKLSLLAFRAALIKSGIEFCAEAMDLGQVVKEDVNGRQFATVFFELLQMI